MFSLQLAYSVCYLEIDTLETSQLQDYLYFDFNIRHNELN